MKDLLEHFSLKHYYNYDELFIEKNYKNNTKLKDIDLNEFWKSLDEFRREQCTTVELFDQTGNKLRFFENEIIKKQIENINAEGTDQLEDLIPDEIKDAALIDSIIDEAFSSSVIEGAFSTRKRAQEMITKKLGPKTKSELMILNNYKAIRYTLENIDEEITTDFIYHIWELLTKNTLEEGDYTECFRTGPVYINNKLGEIVYEGPDHSAVPEMMDNLVKFINVKTDGIHPIIKSMVIHYYFVYIHPFFDGNGRTARALMNLYLMKSGYDFFKYFSISKILVEKRNKYYEAIKTCEDADNDITYFLEFYSVLLVQTITEIRKTYINQFSKKLIVRHLEKTNIVLNSRQLNTLDVAIKNNRKSLDVAEYIKKHKVVQETARKDLGQMVEYGIFEKSKVGKKYVYALKEIVSLISNLSEEKLK